MSSKKKPQSPLKQCTCKKCNHRFETTDIDPTCPKCSVKGDDIQITIGRQIIF